MKIPTLRIAGVLTAAAAALLLASCATPGASGAVAGAWGTADTRGEPSLTFAPAAEGDGGEVSGNDGCNVIGGSYTLTNGTIEFGVLHSTMMFCEGVDTWLQHAHTGTVQGDTLTVRDESGAEIGTLERAK
ncbi:META domain-containing protein [Leucobacter chromiireducens]|uniref:META domain-containing protein n=1 Tax=Leucobacter chromiireducens subsp. solipictus TaxID=398235 RepID=A0ABS1SCR5_9MICO|nr:META domain-containing protein [Leucobacter chromiireducens]MBL3678338.1 META domain-containing protein [Leucobacter chromiireducens subsp. solipictus]